MKKIVYFLLFALCFPIGIWAQSVDDDLYFVPTKGKQEKKETPVKKEPKKQVTTNIYTSPGTTVVIQDRKGRTRDVDEYNRRYDARENEFVMDNDTLYIKEKSNPDLDGEWVTGEFNGTADDYEYAERIIRFRNPRFAISISSPLYWDVVYGPNSWDWNVYTDGLYAYAFPTFSNPLWWDWRYGSYGWGWNYGWRWNYGWGWNRPYYAWGYYPGYWDGWHGGYWGGWYGGGYWGHHHHWHGGPSWGWGGGGSGRWTGPTYTNRRSFGQSSYRNPSTVRRYGSSAVRSSGSSVRGGSAVRSEGSSVRSSGSMYSRGTSSRRVVGTRTSGERSSSSSRSSATYSRPSSTRSSGSSSYSRSSGTTRSSSARSTYSRGSSEAPRSYSPATNTRSSSYGTSRSSSRSYSPSSSGGGSYRGSYSSGGSYRSSGGGSSRSSSARR